MPSAIIAMLVMLLGTGDYAATKAVLSERGELVSASNTGAGRSEGVNRRFSHCIVLLPPLADGEIERFAFPSGPSVIRRSGPVNWGLVKEAYFFTVYTEYGGWTVNATAQPLADKFLDAREVREHRRRNLEVVSRMADHTAEHGRSVFVLVSWMLDIQSRLRTRRSHEWDRWFDLSYTDSNHVSVMAVYDGTLTWWTYNKPEEEQWVERGEFPTQIDSAFRIIRAGESNFYLIDAVGRVFSEPARGHEQVGSATGWGDLQEGERLILLEDQKNRKIALVKIADEALTILPFEGDAGAAEDFLSEIDSADLRAGLLCMAEILDEEEGVETE